MQCTACEKQSFSARYCKKCSEFNCDLCRPACTYAHRQFAVKVRQVKVNKPEQSKPASLRLEATNSSGDDAAALAIRVAAFEESDASDD